MMPKKLILASKSPRRLELLKMLGFAFETKTKEIDERKIEADLKTAFEKSDRSKQFAEILVKELARQKALAVWQSLDLDRKTETIVLASDTCVALDNDILGKPGDEAEAKAILSRLSGKTHQVYTGVSIIGSNHERTFVDVADVTFCDFDDVQKELIEAYVKTGDPFDKAGSYGIQGQAALLIKEIHGDFYTIMGLPIQRVYRELRRLLHEDS